MLFTNLVLNVQLWFAQTGNTSAREGAFKAAIAERDAEIAELKSMNKTLEMEKDGKGRYSPCSFVAELEKEGIGQG